MTLTPREAQERLNQLASFEAQLASTAQWAKELKLNGLAFRLEEMVAEVPRLQSQINARQGR